MRGRAALAALLALTGVVASAAPLVLIVQSKLPIKGDVDPNFVIAPYLAQELESEGRVDPVTWSMLDPRFREWIGDGTAPADEWNPDLRRMLAVAAKQKAAYVVRVEAERAGARVRARIEVFRGNRMVWSYGRARPFSEQDLVDTSVPLTPETARKTERQTQKFQDEPGNLIVFIDGLPDWDRTSRAIAHDWRLQLAQGPFQGLAPRAKPVETNSQTTQTPTVGEPAQDPIATAQELVQKGQVEAALLVIHDAVDADPLDPALRLALANAYLAAEKPVEASREARRAAESGIGGADAWLLAAEAALQAGDFDGGRDALKHARARGAKGPLADQLQGDFALLDGNWESAAEGYGTGSPNCIPGRATALALLGRTEGLAQELAAITEPISPKTYRLCILSVEQALLSLLDELRTIPQIVRTSPGAPKTLQRAEAAATKAEALSTLMDGLRPPTVHEESHAARKLAHVMLQQSALESFRFAKTNDPDAGEEAVASLGQAIRLLNSARENFASERSKAGR
ncbi:MAG: hypothetical protein KIT11_09520 [Fimbriimonadaceae bacterium]|nr:hypothetical protein [Fimbriimonadaceae bacterium]QYK55566.1 MAG: hypothetical protein KF733_11190 [Fimbriimonadaceae bacterium]